MSPAIHSQRFLQGKALALARDFTAVRVRVRPGRQPGAAGGPGGQVLSRRVEADHVGHGAQGGREVFQVG